MIVFSRLVYIIAHIIGLRSPVNGSEEKNKQQRKEKKVEVIHVGSVSTMEDQCAQQ